MQLVTFQMIYYYIFQMTHYYVTENIKNHCMTSIKSQFEFLNDQLAIGDTHKFNGNYSYPW